MEERIIFVCSLIFYENVRKKAKSKLIFSCFIEKKKNILGDFFPCVKHVKPEILGEKDIS